MLECTTVDICSTIVPSVVCQTTEGEYHLLTTLPTYWYPVVTLQVYTNTTVTCQTTEVTLQPSFPFFLTKSSLCRPLPFYINWIFRYHSAYRNIGPMDSLMQLSCILVYIVCNPAPRGSSFELSLGLHSSQSSPILPFPLRVFVWWFVLGVCLGLPH